MPTSKSDTTNDMPAMLADLQSRNEALTARVEELESRPQPSGSVNDETAFKLNFILGAYFFNEIPKMNEAWKNKQDADRAAEAQSNG